MYVGTLSEGDVAQIDPYGADAEGEDRPEYTAEAIEVTPDGRLFSYSSDDGALIRYRIADARLEQRDEVADGPSGAGIQIGATGEGWALVDTAARLVWRAGGDQPVALEAGATIALSIPALRGQDVFLADDVGMLRIPLDGGGDRTRGRRRGPRVRTARPPGRHRRRGQRGMAARGRRRAVALGGGGEVALPYGGDSLPEARRPVFRVSGSTVDPQRDARPGWVWSVPERRARPVEPELVAR